MQVPTDPVVVTRGMVSDIAVPTAYGFNAIAGTGNPENHTRETTGITKLFHFVGLDELSRTNADTEHVARVAAAQHRYIDVTRALIVTALLSACAKLAKVVSGRARDTTTTRRTYIKQSTMTSRDKRSSLDLDASGSGSENRTVETTLGLGTHHSRASSSEGPCHDGTPAGYRPPQIIIHQDEFTSSVVLVKCGQGCKAVKMFFGSLSSSSWVSQAFVDSCKLKVLPIPPRDLIEYCAVNGSAFAPTHYVEVWLRDDSRNMEEFVKHSFNIMPDMGGIELVAGQPYMIKYKTTIDPNRRHDAFVTVAKKGSETAEKHALAQAFATSTTTATLAVESSAGVSNSSRDRQESSASSAASFPTGFSSDLQSAK